MEFYDVVSTAWTNRFYKKEPVDLAVLEKAFDAARFGPQGGNRQPVHFIVVTDPAVKAKLKEWYLVPWNEYLDNARKADIAIGGQAGFEVPEYLKKADDFANELDEIPVLVVAVAELAGLHPTDLDSGRLSIVGGGSVYPSIQNFLLGLRNVGLGGALTTLLCHYEAEVKELLDIPDGYITAATIAVGWPSKGFPKKLSRKPVSEYYSVGKFGQKAEA
ncbi:oxidoreductase [Nakamurella sp. YIM 132087]|uniref:Oxidoreductase n=1 Tax=Nakamurella alba TaxID=2665158 RepID=A0A7K1FLY8_9ACTN|nr:nitroreductase family protein [Nakamurella alba]MTD15126.1 oxidoreductase [Nakamurella alba]